jgi:hypothetical protein
MALVTRPPPAHDCSNAARLAGLRHPLAPTAAFVVGTALVTWVAVEIAIIGYSNEPPLQAIYLVLGVAILLSAIRWLSDPGLPGLHGHTVTRA